MPRSQTLHRGAVSVAEFLCTDGPGAPPAHEQHRGWSISFVRRGSFGCTCRGRRLELVPGSLLVGAPDEEFTCTHDHHAGGDDCLAFFYPPELLDEIAAGRTPWAAEATAPIAALAPLAAWAVGAAQRGDGVALDEAGIEIAVRYVARRGGEPREPSQPGRIDRQRIVDSALWIDAHAAEPIDLGQIAAQALFSPFHHVRRFATVLGVTPHQYLLRCRLRRAAALLAEQDRPITDVAFDAGFGDLSNFVRTFGRAAGLSPRAFRAASRGQRKICQERIERGS